MTGPAKLTLAQWDAHHEALCAAGLREPSYGGPLRRHVAAGDTRLLRLAFDNSPAALRLWNLVLSETDRLFAAQRGGSKIIGAMKDLGTVPLLAYAVPNTVAFYPDATWWEPCLMGNSTADLAHAQRLGIDETFCPVRAMLGAFATLEHFPQPDLLTCSAGGICDDFSAIAQRLAGTGQRLFWWEIPTRRAPDPGEEPVVLPGGQIAPAVQVAFVRHELARVRTAIEQVTGVAITDDLLAASLHRANAVRQLLAGIRQLCFAAARCPLPALEVMLAEALALHFCSDYAEARAVLTELRDEVRQRVAAGVGVLADAAVRLYWVNPVADLRALNLLEDAGGRLVGSDFMFAHALDLIPEDLPPLEALARMALADPMVGPAADRGARIRREAAALGAEALVIARIPGGSHCGCETSAIRAALQPHLPIIDLEVPSLCDAAGPAIRTRLEALCEIARARRAR